MCLKSYHSSNELLWEDGVDFTDEYVYFLQIILFIIYVVRWKIHKHAREKEWWKVENTKKIRCSTLGIVFASIIGVIIVAAALIAIYICWRR